MLNKNNLFCWCKVVSRCWKVSHCNVSVKFEFNDKSSSSSSSSSYSGFIHSTEFLPPSQLHATSLDHELYFSNHLLLSFLNLPRPRPSIFLRAFSWSLTRWFPKQYCLNYFIVTSTHNVPKPLGFSGLLCNI